MNEKRLMISEMIGYGNYGRMANNKTMFTDPQTNSVQIQNNTYAYPTVGNAPSNSFAPVSANNGNIEFEFGINGSLRKRTTPQKTEYYLFNAFNQMKAYSNNGETYGYYGYDAGGQRTYKMILNTVSSNTSTYPNTKILDVEKVQMYPNGYINLDQHGNYTKHYYAGSARIASKIGGGFDDNITCTTDNLKVDYLLEVMKTELGKLTNETVDDIENNFAQITHLIGEDPKSYEDGLYFYHGNHLSSTQLITDMYGAVSQAVLYAPFGQIISEYRSDWMLDTIPRYLFSAMEKDAESGLYYCVSRYYSDEDIVFRGRDVLFEKKPFMSPYAYCRNNPVKYIDPNGEDEYEVNSSGKIRFVEGSEDKPDRLIAVKGRNNKFGDRKTDKNGNEVSIEIKDRSVFENRTEKGSSNAGLPKSTKLNFGSDIESAEAIFNFLDKNTDVEWSAFGVDNGNGLQNFLMTSHTIGEESCGAEESIRADENEALIYHYHNHSWDKRPSDSKDGSETGGDWLFKRSLSPKVRLGILFKGQLYDYDGNTIKFNPGKK